MATTWRGRLSAGGAAIIPPVSPIERRTCAAPDGVAIVYSAVGSGEPALVFIHGGLANRHFWDGQLRTFADQHRVIAPDLPGHGESGSNRDTWSLPRFGTDIRAVLDAEGVGSCVIFGNSLGGPVGTEAALLLPGRVLGVVGVDTFHLLVHAADDAGVRQRAAAFQSDYATSVKEMVAMLFHPDADPDLVAEVERGMSGTPPEAAYGMFLGLVGYDMSISARRLAPPLRAINGDLWPTDVTANRQVKPDFDAMVIRHTGHYPMLERAIEFDGCVAATVRALVTPER